jgi:SAM-dependent methyltransferase
MRRYRDWATLAFAAAASANFANIGRALAGAPPHGVLVDLGCDDGGHTLEFAAAARARQVCGVDVVEERAAAARERGIDVTLGDLNEQFPYDGARFDVVVSNQVIEHLADTDNFVREVHRILCPGGLAVVSTENLASWHNVLALLLGWQPFSLSNVSGTRLGLGNPLAAQRGDAPALRSWEHVRVFAYRGLKELFEAHGFTVENVVGAGYYPLPAAFARLDPRHAAFLTVTARRQ